MTRTEPTFGPSTMDIGVTADPRRAWPFYVVCDVSRSMWDPNAWPKDEAPIDVMNDSLVLMFDSLGRHHEASDIGHLGIVTFAGEATTHYPLSRVNAPGALRPLPQPDTNNWTNYAGVWKHLHDVIVSDVQTLRSKGIRPKQPVVFFITDGRPGAAEFPQPLGEWKPLHDDLCAPSFPERPLIVALGMGDVDEETVLAIRSTDPAGPACIAEDGVPPSVLLEAVMAVIIKSISMSATAGRFRFKVPAGMTRLDTA